VHLWVEENMNLGKENPQFMTWLMICGTCRICDSVRGGGSSWTWWPTTFVTCHLLVPSPTYFEIIIYDLVGSTKVVDRHLWVLSPTYFEIL